MSSRRLHAKKTKKKNIIDEGLFEAELDDFFTRTLSEDGYAGVEVRVNPIKTEIVVRATRPKGVLGVKARRANELTSLISKRFGYDAGYLGLFVERVEERGLCAMAQAESLRYKLSTGVQVRKACYGIVRTIMEQDAKGCEVTVSGKLRAQRAKSMSFRDGYMISTGDPVKYYVDSATRIIKMKSGVMGIQVKIMKAHDPEGKKGPTKPLPDAIVVYDPKPVEAPRVVPPAQRMEEPKVMEVVEVEGEKDVNE